jgi:hypothetical protein
MLAHGLVQFLHPFSELFEGQLAILVLVHFLKEFLQERLGAWWARLLGIVCRQDARQNEDGNARQQAQQ